jgi:hypothetical protein
MLPVIRWVQLLKVGRTFGAQVSILDAMLGGNRNKR